MHFMRLRLRSRFAASVGLPITLGLNAESEPAPTMHADRAWMLVASIRFGMLGPVVFTSEIFLSMWSASVVRCEPTKAGDP